LVAGKTGVGVPDEEPERPQDTEKSDRARAALLEAQMDAALDGIISVSPRDTLLSFNHRFEEIWGLPQGYLKVGSPLSDVVGRISAWVSERAAFEAEILSTNGLAGKVRVGPGGRLKSFSMVDGRTLTFFSAPALDVSGGYHGRVWFFREDPSGPQIAGSDDLLARLHAAERAQAFLLRAAGALAGTSGYLETVERMAEVALPVLGDLFLIDIVDEREEIVRVVARHADPAMQPATDRLLTEFAPDAEAPDPCVQVIQTRRARWAASTSDAFLRASTRNESHYELLRELDFTSYMCVPIFDGDKVLGAVTLVSSGSGRHFGLDDLALVEALSEPVAQVVLRAMQYEQQHGIALVLQTNLLPPSLPDIDGLAVAARYVAGTRGAEVGGDFYDVMRTPSGAVGMMVGDVAGHDPAAAVAMGQVRTASRALAGQVRTPAELVDLMRSSWELIGVDRMATVLYGRLDISSGDLMLASAGHPPPILVSGGRATLIRLDPAPPLGAPGGLPLPLPVPHPPGSTLPEARAGAGSARAGEARGASEAGRGAGAAPRAGASGWSGKLSAGDVLLLYTDGLVERRNRPMQEGTAALTELAVKSWNGDPEELCDVIISQLAGGPERADDVALLAVSIKA
jgi:serine phosphatase RsbU (regulator of sigma subunit)